MNQVMRDKINNLYFFDSKSVLKKNFIREQKLSFSEGENFNLILKLYGVYIDEIYFFARMTIIKKFLVPKVEILCLEGDMTEKDCERIEKGLQELFDKMIGFDYLPKKEDIINKGYSKMSKEEVEHFSWDYFPEEPYFLRDKDDYGM